jgi:hypothetical protein
LESEQVIQKFPHRCPYCDEVVSYDAFNLRAGENEIECPSCKRVYIKVISDSLERPAKLSSHRENGSRRKGGS